MLDHIDEDKAHAKALRNAEYASLTKRAATGSTGANLGDGPFVVAAAMPDHLVSNLEHNRETNRLEYPRISTYLRCDIPTNYQENAISPVGYGIIASVEWQ